MMVAERVGKEPNTSAKDAVDGKHEFEAHETSTAPYGREEHLNEELTKQKAEETEIGADDQDA